MDTVRVDVRAKLALGGPSPVVGRATDPAQAAAAAPASRGELDPDYIKAAIREQLVPAVRECYESSLEDNANLRGSVVLNFEILGHPDVAGVVDDVRISEDRTTLDDAALRECMVESMYVVEMPAPSGGGSINVTYPFVFQP